MVAFCIHVWWRKRLHDFWISLNSWNQANRPAGLWFFLSIGTHSFCNLTAPLEAWTKTLANGGNPSVWEPNGLSADVDERFQHWNTFMLKCKLKPWILTGMSCVRRHLKPCSDHACTISANTTWVWRSCFYLTWMFWCFWIFHATTRSIRSMPRFKKEWLLSI